jgi:chromosome segregation ATPase
MHFYRRYKAVGDSLSNQVAELSAKLAGVTIEKAQLSAELEEARNRIAELELEVEAEQLQQRAKSTKTAEFKKQKRQAGVELRCVRGELAAALDTGAESQARMLAAETEAREQALATAAALQAAAKAFEKEKVYINSLFAKTSAELASCEAELHAARRSLPCVGVPRSYLEEELDELSEGAKRVAKNREVKHFMDFALSREWNMSSVATALFRLGWGAALMEEKEFCKWYGEEVSCPDA